MLRSERMNANDAIDFKHEIIDERGPEDPHIKTVGDINDNGLTDVVVASSNGGPLVWYEAPNWIKHEIASSGTWSCDAKIVDMDNDGDSDILISDWFTHHRLEWYENPRPAGDPSIDPWKLHIVGGPAAHDIEAGDIDGDGQIEIVTRKQFDDGDKVFIWKRSGDRWNQRVFSCPTGEGLAIADINRNRILDVVIGGRWYEGPEDILNGEWKEHIYTEWPNDSIVRVADMNKNGRLDVILARSEGPHHRLSWFEAPVDPVTGSWTEHIIDDSIDFAHSLRVCDVNNDGNLDVVVAEMHQSGEMDHPSRKRVMIFVNEGNAVKWNRQVIATSGSHGICVGDTNGSGNIDIIGANWGGKYQVVEMWKNMS
jgi:hypothetical protein